VYICEDVIRNNTTFSLVKVSEDVTEDTTILEISDFRLSIESCLSSERFSVRGGDCNSLVNREGSSPVE